MVCRVYRQCERRAPAVPRRTGGQVTGCEHGTGEVAQKEAAVGDASRTGSMNSFKRRGGGAKHKCERHALQFLPDIVVTRRSSQSAAVATGRTAAAAATLSAGTVGVGGQPVPRHRKGWSGGIAELRSQASLFCQAANVPVLSRGNFGRGSSVL